MKRTLWSTLVMVALLFCSSMPVAAGPAPPGTQPAAPRVVDMGDGTVALVRDPGDGVEALAAPRRLPVSLPGWAPDAAAEALPGDVFSTYPAQAAPIPLVRLLNAGPMALYDEVVIGFDDRTRVRNTKRYPASAATQIYVTDSSSRRAGDEDSLCSGGIVGAPNLLITAAHCVYDTENGRWYDDWTFFPGMKKWGKAPFGSCSWRTIFVHRKWMRTGERQYDVASVVLDCNVGNRTGWYGASQSSGSGYIAGTHHIYQYPGDKPLGTQWHDAGPWDRVGSLGRAPDGAARVDPAARVTNGVVYTIDTAPGSSGSSVTRATSGGYDLTAVHVAGSAEGNVGVLLWKQVWKKVIYKGYKKATR